MNVVDEETPPSDWKPSEEDLKRMRLATPLDLDAHLGAAPISIQAAEKWFEIVRGPSPIEEVRELLQALDQKLEQLDQKVEHSTKRLEARISKRERNLTETGRPRIASSEAPGASYKARATPPAPPVAPARAPLAPPSKAK